MLATNAKRTKAGRVRICQPGKNRYHAIIAISIENVIRKSAKATTIVAVVLAVLGPIGVALIYAAFGLGRGPNGAMQAPHILVAIHMRGILTHLFSRIYFSDEVSNASDPILKLVPAERRDTLIAKRQPGGNGAVYKIDFQIQGDRETVFFDI